MALLSPETRSGNVKIVSGEAVLDGTNPTSVETGLHTILAVALSLSGSVAPADDTKVLSYDTSGGRVNVYAWSTADGADPTLIESISNDETFSYVAVGY